MKNNFCEIHIPVSAVELIDKITILEIKRDLIQSRRKRDHVEYEYGKLKRKLDSLFSINGNQRILERFKKKLKNINASLWQTEESLRELEEKKDFGEKFIRLARSVYILNDKRCCIKKRINLLLGSRIVEEKSYRKPL